MKLQNSRIKFGGKRGRKQRGTEGSDAAACGLLIKDTYKLAEIFRLRFTAFYYTVSDGGSCTSKNENEL